MKIEKPNKCVKMIDIKDGECFLHGGELYIKVNWGIIKEPNDGFAIAAINLEKNRINAFCDTAAVEVVNAKIVMEWEARE